MHSATARPRIVAASVTIRVGSRRTGIGLPREHGGRRAPFPVSCALAARPCQASMYVEHRRRRPRRSVARRARRSDCQPEVEPTQSGRSTADRVRQSTRRDLRRSVERASAVGRGFRVVRSASSSPKRSASARPAGRRRHLGAPASNSASPPRGPERRASAEGDPAAVGRPRRAGRGPSVMRAGGADTSELRRTLRETLLERASPATATDAGSQDCFAPAAPGAARSKRRRVVPA